MFKTLFNLVQRTTSLWLELKRALPGIMRVIVASAVVSITGHLIFFLGYVYGFGNASTNFEAQLALHQNAEVSSTVVGTPVATPTPRIVFRETEPNEAPSVNWSGPELWEAVNARRRELGVSTLGNQGELCTIASIRLNELLELGKLDGHEGFSSLPERREDLKWIFEKYNISEFLVSGASSAQEAVNLWENTLGHKILLTGGEYVWGCTYAQNGFGVAIAAY